MSGTFLIVPLPALGGSPGGSGGGDLDLDGGVCFLAFATFANGPLHFSMRAPDMGRRDTLRRLPASAPRRRSASVVPPVVWWCPRVRPRRPHPVHRAPALFHLGPLRCRGSRLPLLPVVAFLAVCVPPGPGPGPGVHHPSPHRPWSLAAHVGFRIPLIHPPRRRWPKRCSWFANHPCICACP